MTMRRAVTSWLKADKLTNDFKLTSERNAEEPGPGAEPANGRYPTTSAKLIHLIRHSLPSIAMFRDCSINGKAGDR